MKVKRASHIQQVSHIGISPKSSIYKVNNLNKTLILALLLENN